MKISALIQTRMGSTRLPGKVLKDIEGKSVLWHVINRLRRSTLLNQIAVVTTTDTKDDALEHFCRIEGVDCFRGSEDDVLDRYYRAAEQFRTDQIVRITSDCPLIDPEIVDLVIRKHLDSKSDYTSNTLERSFPRGMDTEIFTEKALKKAHREAVEPPEREHVTPYFYRHPELFKLTALEADADCRKPELRLCVDVQEDLDLIRTVHRKLKGTLMSCWDIVSLYETEPELFAANAHVRQKNL